MKLTLFDALHARPANLFVRVASGFVAVVAIRTGERRANAKNILEVLTLGAAKGDTLEIEATGDDADAAIAALAVLVERNFDADLVSETGAAAAAGIAVGPALVLAADEATDVATSGVAPAGSVESAPFDVDASARLATAFAQVGRDLEAMIRSLPAEEAALFEPEITIVSALQAPVAARVLRGEGFEHALGEEVPIRRGPAVGGAAKSDLLLDARQRLLEAYAGQTRPRLGDLIAKAAPGDVVLVAHQLTPSLVATLPRRVTGIVAGSEDLDAAGGGYASHAAILARGRGIPLLLVAPHVAEAIGQGDVIVLDARTSPPQLWTSPSEARVMGAQAAVAEERRLRRERESHAAPPLAHLPSWGGAPFAIRVNISGVHDYVPAASDGVGLVRTELLHAVAPALDEQLALLALVAGKVGTGPVVVRLFDGGGDKPITWLPAPADAPDARGIELLLRHPDVLRTQVIAIARAGEAADMRLLIPLVRGPSDVEHVRSLAPAGLSIGAMIESPEASRETRAIAEAADFVCIGTNDLTALIRGEDRVKAAAAPLDPRVLAIVADIVDAAHGAGRTVTVCGEMAGEPDGAVILAGLGVDAVSVAPSRLVAVRGALAKATSASCAEAARTAMGKKGAVP